jgi:hypothetical protein
MKISTTLQKARDLISTPERWGKHLFAADADGRAVGVRSDLAQAFCVRGAIQRFEGGGREGPAESFLASLVLDEAGFCSFSALGEWNNKATHDEVLLGLDFAILLAKDEGK